MAVLSCFALAAPAAAQSVETRVGKLESEMRAVQRRVFPEGAGRLLQPEVSPSTPSGSVPGVPATSPVVDLTARVTALEGQIAQLTGQAEQNGYRVRQLEEAFEAYRRSTDTRLKAAEARGAPAETAAADPAPEPSRPAARPATPTRATSADPARAGQATAVERPSTGDAAEDAYIYGYRLWDAKLYPEAQAQLKKVVTDYPKSRRASFAQNLLGRAYLDEGKPSLASIAFYDNYKKMPDGERAPDSLLYLGQALVKLKKPADACKVYTELTDVYGERIDAQMKADVARGRAAAKCS